MIYYFLQVAPPPMIPPPPPGLTLDNGIVILIFLGICIGVTKILKITK
ncbi:MAG: hypothetical protein AB8B78_08915 [Polaribacter sp.]